MKILIAFLWRQIRDMAFEHAINVGSMRLHITWRCSSHIYNFSEYGAVAG
jgi:hypothetical protein